MYPDEITKIKKLLKERNLEHLYCKQLEKREYQAVLEILNLPYWENPIYRPLLTSNIWNTTSSKIKTILELPHWEKQDEKGNYIYSHLLTSNIWSTTSSEIQSILDLPYWEKQDEKGNYIYRDLLTSTIWNTNVSQIKSILDLPYWENPIYMHLLTPTIWNMSEKRIKETIEIFEEYKIESFITSSALRKSRIQIVALIHYLQDNNLPLIIDEKLNPIFNVASTLLKKRYGIDLKELVKIENQRKGGTLCIQMK